MRRPALLAGLAFAAACGGSSGAGSVLPAETPDATVTRFLRAVADSNITAMAQLWGTSAGPAAVTRQPDRWEQRVQLIRYYLRHDAARITGSSVVTGQPDRHNVVVDLARQGCRSTVPFVLVRQPAGGWLVNEIELDAVGNPARKCNPGAPPGS